MAVDRTLGLQPTPPRTACRHLQMRGGAGREMDAADFERRSVLGFARTRAPVNPSRRRAKDLVNGVGIWSVITVGGQLAG